MGKAIAAFNMTLDGICDHTTGVADQGLHRHYSDLLNDAGTILYGRTTYELMKFWQTLLQNPSGDGAMDDFAISIDKVQKIIFSNTLKVTGWDSAKLATKSLDKMVLELKQQEEKDILVGSRSLIVKLLNSNLIDEFQLCIHPVIEGKGLFFFNDITDKVMLKLNKTKVLGSGAIVLYYAPMPK